MLISEGLFAAANIFRYAHLSNNTGSTEASNEFVSFQFLEISIHFLGQPLSGTITSFA